METDLYIEKNRPDDDLFSRLRRQGIAHIQDLSGSEWTDYNIHDPGVTILEQLCYGLTELVYKAGFSVEDLLAAHDGTLDYETLALFPPEQILPNQALTCRDYMKYLFDAVPDIANIWVKPDRKAREDGLYHISVRFRKTPGRQQEAALLQQMRQYYAAARNLCEDIGGITVLQSKSLILHTRVEVVGSRHPELILAKIYNDCQAHITPTILYREIHRDEADTPPDRLLVGPLLKHGVVDDEDVPDPLQVLDIPALARIIRAVEGVEAVLDIFLEDAQTGEIYDTLVLRESPDTILTLHIPELEEEVQVTLVKKGRLVPISLGAALDHFQRLTTHHRDIGHSRDELKFLEELPKGRFRHPGQYRSVQELFPYIYGINHFGVPKSYPEKTKAAAKQLKGYLLLFEQIIANISQDIEMLPRLFSRDKTLDQSYFSKIIDDSCGPDLEALYGAGRDRTARALEGITRRHDRFVDRRSRLLDYLLAVYGEKFTQNSLAQFNYYYPGPLFSRYLLSVKLRFLEHLPRLNRKRGSGHDYTRPSWNTDNIAGLKHKVSLLLGFETHEQRSLTLAFTRHGLELISDDEFRELNQGTFEIQFVEPRDIQRRMHARFREVPYLRTRARISRDEIHPLIKQTLFMKNNLFNKSSLTFGMDLANFRIGSFTGQTWQVIFRPYSGARWCYLASFRKRHTAIRSANNVCRFIRRLNIMSEGLHIVEHILLRPGILPDSNDLEVPEGFFSSRLSVIFPAWTPRCDNRQFRYLAEETVRLNAPAHLAIDFYWLEFRQMLEFEIRFHDWLENSAPPGTFTDGEGEEDRDETGFLAQRLLEFLISLKQPEKTPIFL